ncbi:MAG: hypothetical protein Q9167_006804 [Letrouitia subvulpina]
MKNSYETGSPFAIPDLWQKSSLVSDEQLAETSSNKNLGTLISDLRIDRGYDHPLIAFAPFPTEIALLDFCVGFEQEAFKSLNLEKDSALFVYGPLEDLTSNASLSVSSSHDTTKTSEPALEDLWSPNIIINDDLGHPELQTWENFHTKSFKEPPNAYLSEGGPRVFDAALHLGAVPHVERSNRSRSTLALPSETVVLNLYQLGMGRNSSLFRYIKEANSFQSQVEDLRISGYSRESFASLMRDFIDYGNKQRKLHTFIESIMGSNKSYPTLVALASVLSNIHILLQKDLGEKPTSVPSVLHLQQTFRQPGELLLCISKIIERVQHSQSDGELVSRLFSIVQEHEFTTLQPLMFQIFKSASKPWLESVEIWLGLGLRTLSCLDSARPNFIQIAEYVSGPEEEKNGVEFQVVPELIPNCLSNEDAEVVFEGGQSLRLLHAHQPEHPLINGNNVASEVASGLEWQYSMQEIERVQDQANNYEMRILEALKQFDSTGKVSKPEVALPKETSSEQSTSAGISPFVAAIGEPLPDIFSQSNSSLVTAVSSFLDRSTGSDNETSMCTPPVFLIPSLSFSSALATQSRLLSRGTLRLLFKNHSLRSHLRLLHRYPLFADGPFLTRLSHALFDPSLPSSARQKDQHRSGLSGLKLGARDNWPPASSELRLALIGILAESYFSHGTSLSMHQELPGGLSFAIRTDMKGVELENCMDPDGVEALDFLKLQYRAPKPLDAVITEACLDKYNRVSQMLLRGARMLFVTKQLMSNTLTRPLERGTRFVGAQAVVQKFKIEAFHLVTTVLSYFSDSIREIWQVFERELDEIESRLNSYEAGVSVGGIRRLCALHEEVLDRMLQTCLLRKRQAQVMALLEEIWSLILAFAKVLRQKPERWEDEVRKLYERWRKKVRVFTTVCKGLSEKKGGGSKGLFTREEGGIDRLEVGLDMNGYYMRSNATREITSV